MRAHNTIDKISLEDQQKIKDQAIINIAAKVENLANKYLKNAKTYEDKKSVIENIKNKVIETAYRRHVMIHDKHDEIKTFGNLIAKGMALMIKRNLNNDSRRIDTELRNDVEKEKHKITNEYINENMPVYTGKDNRPLDCNYNIGETCAEIKSLNKISCIYDKKVFSLNKLCDGIVDCLDRSDEQNCPEQAIEKIRKAGKIMAEVDSFLVHKCVMSNLVSEQNEVFRNVLKSQLKFIEKYTDLMSYEKVYANRRNMNERTLRKTANEVALVVSSLGMALDGSLCTRRVGTDDINTVTNKYTHDDDPHKTYDDLLKMRWTVLRTCDCKGLLCSTSNCTDSCKRVCWQKYNLDRWFCRAVEDGPSVPLDTICDGKLDCYDETDESGCDIGTGFKKFEANSMYDQILKLLSTKSNLEEYHLALNDLLALRESIKLLQKLSAKTNVEMVNIKMIRDRIFSKMTSIYEQYLQRGNKQALNDIYDFLISLNEKLVGAMKRSRTGNDRIIASAGCYCTGTRCGMLNCSKLCTRACSVEPLLSRYRCGNIKLNNSVPIESVCDGKPSCPNGEDEIGCKKEVCRRHHLVLLRHNLQEVGNKQKGTGLGEALLSWRTKVTSMILLAEKNDRPTPKEFRYIISNMLHDLVMSYAHFEEFRRNTNERNLKEFEKLSQQVIESIKTCENKLTCTSGLFCYFA